MRDQIAHPTPQRALAEKVRALRDPAIYPHAPRRVETIETHFAWVFLTDEYAYKLKKTMQIGRMNHSTLEARHRSCVEELRLNRRLAPDVYLDVVALAQDASGELRLAHDGAAVDWLIKMRRLDQHLLLDHAVKAHTVTTGFGSGP